MATATSAAAAAAADAAAVPIKQRRAGQATSSEGGRRPSLCKLWRPWEECSFGDSQGRTNATTPETLRQHLRRVQKPASKLSFKHPVKLYWSRSRVFDHLYADGERLLEGFPVQATIALCDSDSEESDSEDSEDEREHVEE
ncbi:protein ripply2.1-like isoform X2 [Petromyzon marinus]|uniref:Protein ripply2-like n=1 Tax=Petromyzon marinus TaxID=7757 RepID=A0AAJ7U4H9_PETMA|nr:protein ripply2-like [Petromyzon marinus]